MSTASYLRPEDIPISLRMIPPEVESLTPRPLPLQTLTAAATRITSAQLKSIRTNRTGSGSSWQGEAWEMFDLVGEHRFLNETVARRTAQARLFVGKLPENPLEPPEPTKDKQLQELLSSLGKGSVGQSRLLERLALNLSIAGEGYLVGVPPKFLDEEELDGGGLSSDMVLFPAIEQITPILEDTLTIDDLRWFMLSISEVTLGSEDEVTLTLLDGKKIKTNIDEVYLIRIWNSHPRVGTEATSPTRASLPVLRELVGLTMHISAQIDSRLAGAGILVVPDSIVKAMKTARGLPEDSEDDPFTDELITAMMTPIDDRSNASAVVPLVVTVPDETVAKMEHITFSTPLDAEAKDMRDEAIRRLALGLDAPPELLLGVAGMNHWGAWLVREDVVTTHLEPTLALICDALTTQFLRPVMEAYGTFSPEEIEEYVVWYDVSHLVMRPNRSEDADRLYEKGAISDETLRATSGFGEMDAPDTAHLSTAELTVFEMVKTNASLQDPESVAKLLETMQTLLGKESIDTKIEELQKEAEDVETVEEETPPPPTPEGGEVTADVEPVDETSEGGTPNTSGETSQPEPTVEEVK